MNNIARKNATQIKIKALQDEVVDAIAMSSFFCTLRVLSKFFSKASWT